ncbi:MAG: helix-turn-helix domain-containing protein [Eubacteriales bacterium]
MMEYELIIQSVLDEIDKRITENIQADELARVANYSTYHFRRIFIELTGTPFMSYVTRRKLEYALYDISQGERIIDVAMDYGFETHAGFNKAFKKHFGSSPSLYRLHISASAPPKATVYSVKLKYGGINMQVQIEETKSQTVVGYSSRHRMPNVNKISDIPVFWQKINLEYEAALSTLHHTYTKSNHCEIAVCFDINDEHDCFTYMLGVGVDEVDSTVLQRPGTYLYRMQGGLYAIFTTPLVDEEQYVQSIQDTWKQILDNWLPGSEYEYDNTRVDYEYYDERDHSWLHDGKSRMDIYIPIRIRK